MQRVDRLGRALGIEAGAVGGGPGDDFGILHRPGDRIGQGKDNAREFLRENPDIAREIENRIRESLGVNAMASAAPVGAAAEVADEEE